MHHLRNHGKRIITSFVDLQLAFVFNDQASSIAADGKVGGSGTHAASAADASMPMITQSAPTAGEVARRPRGGRRRWGRYRTVRRPRASAKPFLGYGAYRLVVAGGLAHVIGPGGVPCSQLTSWARHELAPPPDVTDQPGARRASRKHDPAAEVRRVRAALDKISNLLDAINWVHPTYPDVLSDLLDERTAPTREVVHHWLRLRGCDVGNGRGRAAGKIIVPPSGDAQWLIGTTISSLRQVFDFWNDAGIRVAPNPIQMDKDRSRTAGKSKQMRNCDGLWFADVDSFYRVKALMRQAPRPHDASIPRRILDRGREVGWPVEVSLKFETMYRTGGRIGQTDAMTAFGLMVAAKDTKHVALIQKGSKGLLRWQCRIPADLRARLVDRVAGFVGGMDELKKLASRGNEIGHALLAKIYVFSADGREPTPHWRSAHLLRQVVEELGLSFEIQRDDGATVTKHFTSHWFRHFFVNGMLDRIAASAADAQRKEDLRVAFARYMGWRNHLLMLQYYGRHHFDQEVGLLVAEHQDALNSEFGSEFEEEDLLVPANDNTVFATGRASGDFFN